MKTIALITYGRSLMALTIAESVTPLVDRVIGIDTIGMTALSFSKYCDETRTVCPPSEERQYADEIAAICNEFSDDTVIIIPGFEDMEGLARHRDLLPSHVRLAAPQVSSIEQVTPKHHFAKLVKEYGINAPETEVFETEEAAREGPSMGFPMLMKPSHGAGGRGISTLKDRDAYEAYLKDHADNYPLLGQSLASGDDYCVSALAHEGEVLVLSAYTNLENQPREAGAGVVRETVSSDAFEADIRKIAETSMPIRVFGDLTKQGSSMVRVRRLELPRHKTLEPKSCTLINIVSITY